MIYLLLVNFKFYLNSLLNIIKILMNIFALSSCYKNLVFKLNLFLKRFY